MNRSPVISFNRARNALSKKRQLLLTLKLFKESGDDSFSYVMSNFDIQHKAESHDIVMYGLTRVVEDIAAYSGDPCDILEMTQEIMARLGFQPESTESD